jgi:hypothetical protein
MAPYHDSMAVLLTRPEEWDLWLSGDADPMALLALLNPARADLLEAFPVTRDLLKLKDSARKSSCRRRDRMSQTEAISLPVSGWLCSRARRSPCDAAQAGAGAASAPRQAAKDRRDC